MKTIIYLTDNSLDERIAILCREYLVKAAGGRPIISVSQKPIDFEKNICVGDIGRSWISLYRQQLVGLYEAKTEFIAIAEHDVLYTEEHFNWTHPCNGIFFFNDNRWFVRWADGLYCWCQAKTKALSQLICDRKLLIQSVEERLYLLESEVPALGALGEPGAFRADYIEKAKEAVKDGKHPQLADLFEKHIAKFKARNFRTAQPNLDIRHDTNFTGKRKTRSSTWNLPPWGEFKDVIGGTK